MLTRCLKDANTSITYFFKGFSLIWHVFLLPIKHLFPWCKLYADGIVLCGTRREEVEKKLEERRRAMEDRGLNINIERKLFT